MLNVDLDDPTPLYVQIVQGIKLALARGEVSEGQQLPSVRQLAGDLDINLNTVARAYRQLEEEGFLRVRHGRGARVVQTTSTADPERARALLARSLQRVFADALLAALGREEIERAVLRGLDALDAGAHARAGVNARDGAIARDGGVAT